MAPFNRARWRTLLTLALSCALLGTGATVGATVLTGDDTATRNAFPSNDASAEEHSASDAADAPSASGAASDAISDTAPDQASDAAPARPDKRATDSSPAPAPGPGSPPPAPAPDSPRPAPAPAPGSPPPAAAPDAPATTPPTQVPPASIPPTSATPAPATPAPAAKPNVAKGPAAKPSPLPPAGTGSIGVPAGTPLRVHPGDLTITTPGTVVDGLDIRGFVRVEAPNVTIKNTIIRGRASDSTSILLYAGSGTSPGLRVIDSELAPTHKTIRTNGVYGYDFSLTRVDIRDVIDAVHIFGNNVTIADSHLHDNLHYANDPGHDGGPSHDDSIQIQVGQNIRIVGNTLSGAYNAAVQITQDRGRVANVTIAKNHISGGGCSINVAEKGRGAIAGLAIEGNVFGESRFGCHMLVPPTTKFVNADNTVLEGTPLALNRRAQ